MTLHNKKRAKTQKLPPIVDPLTKLEALNKELKAAGYEVVIRQIPTKDVVAFDFGLVFTKDSKEVGLYVDDTLREVLIALANEHGQVLVKTNWFSPDVMAITPADNPDPLQNTPDTDVARGVQEALRGTEQTQE